MVVHGTANRFVGGGDIVDREQDPVKRVDLDLAALQPDVRLVHRGAVLRGEHCLPVFDQCFRVGELGPQLRGMSGVGDEFRARQAGVSLIAQLFRWERAPTVGQDAISSLVELDQVVEVGAVDRGGAPVTGDLLVAEEFLFHGLRRGHGVVQGHVRRNVPEVAHHDVKRHSGVDQVGRRGVPEPTESLMSSRLVSLLNRRCIVVIG